MDLIACVAWRFSRAGRSSSEVAGRKVCARRAGERAPKSQSPRGFSAFTRLYYFAHSTKTAMLRRLWILMIGSTVIKQCLIFVLCFVAIMIARLPSLTAAVPCPTCHPSAASLQWCSNYNYYTKWATCATSGTHA